MSTLASIVFAAASGLQRPDALPAVSVDDTSIATILSIAFSFLGALSVLMIALQGMRYSLSGGDPGKTTQARNGIIYSAVGIAVAISGMALTRFVLDRVLIDEGAAAPGLLIRVAGLIALITGVISVIMIIVGGMRYVLSDGDAGKASSARQTIIYALIGAVIAAFAAPLALYIVEQATS